MDRITLRALLLFIMGGFLLFAGVFMDAMGKKINSDKQNSFGLPFNPLMVVGQFILAVGAVMLVSSAVLLCRFRLTKNKRTPYESAPTNPVRLVDRQPRPNAASQPQPTRTQPRQNRLQPSVQMTTYATALGTRNMRYAENPQLSGGRITDSPTAATLLPHSSTLGAQNPRRHSGTLGSNRDALGYGSARLQSIGFTPIYSDPDESTSTYSSRGEVSCYSTLPIGQVSSDTSSYNWRSHLMKQPNTRTTPSSPTNLDEPPPYESQEMSPPPYYP